MKKPIQILFCSFFLFSLTTNQLQAQSEEYFFQYKEKPLPIVDMALCSDGGVVFCLTKEVLHTYVVLKIDAKKSIVWSKEFDVPNETYGFKPTIASKNNAIYISMADKMHGSFGSYISKLDEHGTILWSKKWYLPESTGTLFEYPQKPTITAADELILMQGMENYSQVVKLNAAGALLFSKEIDNDTMISKNPGFDFFQTADGGFVLSSAADHHCVITKLSSKMEKIWSKKFSFDNDNHPKAIHEMKNGNLLIGGYAIDLQERHCFFTYVIDPNGKLLHRNYYNSDFYPNEIVADGETIRFSCQYGITGVLNEQGEIVSYSKIDQDFFNYHFELEQLKHSVVSFDNNILFYENFEKLACVETFDIVPSTENVSLRNNARVVDVELFVDNQGTIEPYNLQLKTLSHVKFEKTCSILSQTNEEEAETESVMNQEVVVVLPDTESPQQTAPTPVATVSWPEDRTKVYPNPVTNELHIDNFSKFGSYELLALNGAMLIRAELTAPNIDLSEFPKGIYILNLIRTDGGQERIKLIKE